MSKKVLAIAGSPRKGGNSDLLCDAFLRGGAAAGHATEKLYVQDLHLAPCLACYGCRNTGRCVQRDGMDAALEKLEAADVVVLATPVYFYSLSGQLKTFIDRTLPRYTKIRDKEFYFIATAADGNAMLKTTMLALRGFTDCLPGAVVKQELYGGGYYERGEVIGSPAEREAYEAGLHA